MKNKDQYDQLVCSVASRSPLDPADSGSVLQALSGALLALSMPQGISCLKGYSWPPRCYRRPIPHSCYSDNVLSLFVGASAPVVLAHCCFGCWLPALAQLILAWLSQSQLSALVLGPLASSFLGSGPSGVPDPGKTASFSFQPSGVPDLGKAAYASLSLLGPQPKPGSSDATLPP